MKYQSSNTRIIYDIEFEMDRKKRYKCPECSNGRKNSKAKDLEYYPDTQRGFCFHCQTTLFEYKPYQSEKQYTVPEWKNITSLSDKAVKYFQSRMISQETLNKMKIYTDTEWMPQFNKEVEVICFPYFRNNKLINVKYRGANKSFKLVSNAELIWFNYDAILNDLSVIVCEGEIDVLTWVENGYNNAISVPNGAKSKADYLDNSIDLFDNVEKIYLATDCDNPGLELKDELIRRFGAERCFSINFKDCKDSNEYFCKYGGIEFSKLIDNAEPIPVKGNIEIHSIYNDIIDLYENGLQPGLTIGIDEIDKYCTWELGRLCTVTGIPSSGKSEFVDQLICYLNHQYGWKAAYFTPENYPLRYHYAKIHEKFSGSKFKKEQDKTDFFTIYEHIKDNFFYILNEDDLTVESVIKSAQSYVKSKGIKILVVDPYNKLDHQMKRTENETQYISRFLDTLIKFARFNNVLVFLIAHPVKMEVGKVPTLYNISGSANFYNKTDYGFTVHRVMNEDNTMKNEVEVHWQKIKFKHLGVQGISELSYNINNGRFDEVGKYDNMPLIGEIKYSSNEEFIEPDENEWFNDKDSDELPF